MNDLISREQAIELLNLNKPNVDEKTKYAMWQFDKDLNTIKTMPSAEKTGKWLDIGKFTDIDGNHHEVWKCDYCGYISYDDSNFCPLCGARMED